MVEDGSRSPITVEACEPCFSSSACPRPAPELAGLPGFSYDRPAGEQKRGRLYYGDNLEVLRRYVKDESVDLVYLDPPFKGGSAPTIARSSPSPFATRSRCSTSRGLCDFAGCRPGARCGYCDDGFVEHAVTEAPEMILANVTARVVLELVAIDSDDLYGCRRLEEIPEVRRRMVRALNANLSDQRQEPSVRGGQVVHESPSAGRGASRIGFAVSTTSLLCATHWAGGYVALKPRNLLLLAAGVHRDQHFGPRPIRVPLSVWQLPGFDG
jgi:hypothetical protein